MKVFKKLQQARVALLDANLKKSGKNKFAGFEYFELGDFMPTINKIFLDIGLCGVVHFTNDYAILTIYDADSEAAECIDFRSPMVFASNPKGQAIQDLGSTHTYLRRYLWLLAMDIVESDTVDALPQKDAPKVDTPKPTPKVDTPKPAKTDPAQQAFFVDKAIEEGKQCESLANLSSLWKNNQKQIDEIKATNKDEFTRLQTAFADIKSSFQE
jgi:hypothetical protein